MKNIEQLLPKFAKGDMSFVRPEHVQQMAIMIISMRTALAACQTDKKGS